MIGRRISTSARDGATAVFVGALVAVSLASAESLAVIVAGGWPRPDWWRLLVFSYVPLLAFGQAAIWAASHAWGRPIRQPSDPTLLLTALLFVHMLTALTQQAYRFVPWSHPPKLALALYAVAAAFGVATLLGRTRPPRFHPGELLIPFAIVVAAAEAEVHEPLHRWSVAAVMLTPLLVVATAGAAYGWAKRAAASVAIVLVVGVPVALYARRTPVRESKHFVSSTLPKRAGSARQDPNILMIVLDTVRAANVSAYGYARATTPRLDALARRGRLYTRFSIVGLASLTSHASLLTGLYPSRHGAGSAGQSRPDRAIYPLDRGFQTLAETLLERGYLTAAVSANSERVGRRAGLDQGFVHFDARRPAAGIYAPLRERVNLRLQRLGWESETTRRLSLPFREADEIVDAALEWLDGPAPASPYFLFLNFMDAHEPYSPPPPFQSYWPAESDATPAGSPPSPAIAEKMAAYDASLRFLDGEIGRLLDQLAGRPRFEDTWIFVLSDHGEAFGEHGTVAHGPSAYDEVVRVPLIVVPPAGDGAPRGVVDDGLAQIVDVAPTILARVGEPIDSLDGIPLDEERAASYIELLDDARPGRREDARVWIRGSYKLVSGADESALLYDLDTDPTERNDLVDSHPELVEELRAELDAFVEELSRRGLARPRSLPLYPDEVKTLRALGYIR